MGNDSFNVCFQRGIVDCTGSTGTSGQVLSSTGSSYMKWVANSGGGGGGSPGGSDTQVQYNDSGSFGGSSNMTFNGTALSANTICGTAGNHLLCATGSNSAITLCSGGSNANIYLCSTGSNAQVRITSTGSNGVSRMDGLNGVELSHGGSFSSTKLATTSTGVTVTGCVNTSLSVPSSANGVRKITASTSAPSGGADGDIWIKYTA